ncbi:unnamed protein product, partial [Rotaria sp. Silwood2]
MPDNRIAFQLTIPARHRCRTLCNSPQQRHIDIGSSKCKSKQPEMISIHQDKCDCSPDSVCIGIVNNRSICLCPLTKTSPQCLLNSICQMKPCINGSICVPYSERFSFINFTCVCQEGFYGKVCEHKDVQIDILFSNVPIPQVLLVHFITVRKFQLNNVDPVPIRATMFKKIGFDQNTVTFFMSLPFHLVFSQIENQFYLTVLQHNFTSSEVIPTQIVSSEYC